MKRPRRKPAPIGKLADYAVIVRRQNDEQHLISDTMMLANTRSEVESLIAHTTVDETNGWKLTQVFVALSPHEVERR